MIRFYFEVLVIFVVVLEKCDCARNVLTIGALLHEDEDDLGMAFVYALQRRNMFHHDIKFKGKISKVPRSDTFTAKKIICKWLEEDDGLAAIVGPTSPKTSCIAASIAEAVEVPHIEIHWKPSKSFPSLAPPNAAMTLNFYPDQNKLAQGIAKIVKSLEWNNYLIIYEDKDSLIRLQDVLKIPDRQHEPVPIRQIQPGGDHRGLLKQFKDSLIFHIILDCRIEVCYDILKQAKDIGFLDYVDSFLLTNLDSHTLDIKSLNTKANITTIRLVNPENKAVVQAVRDWTVGEITHNRSLHITPETMKTEMALMDDAVTHVTETISELHQTERIESRRLSCEGGDKWEGGIRIASFLRVHPMMNSATGKMSFDQYGRRDNFILEVVEFVRGEPEKTCEWDSLFGNELTCSRSESRKMQTIIENLQKDLVIVTSKLGPPYLVRRQKQYTGQNLTGNAQFDGYSMDLIDAIASILNFTYEFRLTRDNTNGAYDEKTKSWNGMIRDLLDRRAHMAICDLTITHARRSVVDFSVPFMSLGISVLYRKAKESEVSLLAFLDPLETEVWLYILTFLVIVTLIMYFLTRLAPGDWVNPNPLDKNPTELENIWTLKNCSWLMLGSTMSCGCAFLPRGISSRMGISMWWFLILIITNSYQANLAAFLTKTRMGSEIDSAEALSKQTKVKYGTVDGGSTQSFFKDAKANKVYQKMWQDMIQAKPTVFEKTNEDGVKRVLNAKNRGYAFLMESSQIEYEIERNCDLMQIGTRLDNKGYGIAMPVNSPYRSAINKAILKLQEDGTLSRLKKKWWKEMLGAGQCDTEGTSTPTNTLAFTFANVKGVFMVMALGISIAFTFTVAEFLWNARKLSIQEHIGYSKALVMDLRFAVRVWATQKKINSATGLPSLTKENSESMNAINFSSLTVASDEE